MCVCVWKGDEGRRVKSCRVRFCRTLILTDLPAMMSRRHSSNVPELPDTQPHPPTHPCTHTRTHAQPSKHGFVCMSMLRNSTIEGVTACSQANGADYLDYP